MEAASSIKDDADLPKATGAINRSSGELASGEPKVRELAAAHLGDLLIGACRAGLDTSSIVLPLVNALTREADPVVQEEIAHSLGHLVEYGTVSDAIVGPLRECMPRLCQEAADHVTDVLEAAPGASDGRNDQASADSEAAEVPPEPSGISPFGAMNRRLCNGSEACRDFVS
ncbi:hypothetical protein AB0H37_30780 [Actinomadura sp. NPDC023710]|uniref:hypothetical protein n=1 Tax=Actinomadura sp. NPDC023710 TaxID=3158219 RepID=UPI003402E062